MDNFQGIQSDKLLEDMQMHGWSDAYLQTEAAKNMHGSMMAHAVAEALIDYWRKNPTLENYAIQVNGAGRFFSDPADSREAINEMSRIYVQEQSSNLPQTVADCYAQLRFWDGLDLPEVENYTQLLSDRFAELQVQEGYFGPEMNELLASRDLSPLMKDVRKKTILALRTDLKTRLALLRSPAERMSVFLDVATHPGGARIVDDELWQQAEHWATQAAKTSEDGYFYFRNILENAADGEIAERPRETLDHIQSLIAILDQKANYGQDGDPLKSIAQWRSRQFEGIPDEALLPMYQRALEQNPSARSQLSKDLPLLEGRPAQEQYHALLTHRGQVHDRMAHRKDGHNDRVAQKSGVDQAAKKKILYTVLLILALLLLMGIVWVLGADKIESRPAATSSQESPSPAETEAATQAPVEVATTAVATEQAKTPSPTATASPTLTPTPTPSPTPSPTQEPAVSEEPLDDGLEEVIDPSLEESLIEEQVPTE